jgi:hypothetical protein
VGGLPGAQDHFTDAAMAAWLSLLIMLMAPMSCS